MSVFEADAEGWRRMNSGRPAHELIREAVQNVFDEVANGATKLDISIEYADEGVDYVITDDVPGGIRDERLIWTIWLSDKDDSPQKRGRMGRGLKELISVANWSLVVTAGGPAVQFERYRGNWTRTSPRKVRPKTGTVVSGRVTAWGAADVKEAVKYLKHMRPPAGLAFTVNGETVARTTSVEAYALKLPTVLFEVAADGERVERNPRREVRVELIAESPTWIYEMGIPVEQTDYPLSIDVEQRIPLREKRDTLTEPYRRELFAKLLDARSLAGRVPTDSLRDNCAILAAQAPEHLSTATKKLIADAWTGGAAYATTSAILQQATGQHMQAVLLRKLPEGVRDIVRAVGVDAEQVLENRAVAACRVIQGTDQTLEMRRLISIWEWISRGIGRSCTVYVASGRPSAAATFNRNSRILTLYVECAPDKVAAPLGAAALSLLIHELAHWRAQDNEHGFGFHSDAESVGGATAAFLLAHAKEARAMLGEGE